MKLTFKDFLDCFATWNENEDLSQVQNYYYEEGVHFHNMYGFFRSLSTYDIEELYLLGRLFDAIITVCPIENDEEHLIQVDIAVSKGRNKLK